MRLKVNFAGHTNTEILDFDVQILSSLTTASETEYAYVGEYWEYDVSKVFPTFTNQANCTYIVDLKESGNFTNYDEFSQIISINETATTEDNLGKYSIVIIIITSDGTKSELNLILEVIIIIDEFNSIKEGVEVQDENDNDYQIVQVDEKDDQPDLNNSFDTSIPTL